MNKVEFKLDSDKCIGCGNCIKTCVGGVIEFDMNKKPMIKDFNQFGWNGCWKCEHCLAVCPTGAISIFNKKPENSLSVYDINTTTNVFNSIVLNRHSCRRFKNKDVDENTVYEMLDFISNAPNGGNKQQVEFTLINDVEQMDYFRNIAYSKMDELAQKGIYPKGFDKKSYDDMKRWEKTVRPDMLFCSAPNILIPHCPLGSGEPVQDTIISAAYFELLCASRGLGAIIMTFALDVLNCMPEIKSMLNIPDNHYIGAIIGFGYPEITYFRGVQKKMDKKRIHILDFKEKIKC